MAIGGQVRERSANDSNQPKKVGLFEGKVIVINPSTEEFKNILGIELAEDSKATEYLGERDGNKTLRISVWLQDIKTEQKFNCNFFLEDKERENKDKTKYQYINALGTTTWAANEDEIQQWFKGTADNPKDYRVAYSGEEELYDFMRNWLSKFDFSLIGADFTLDWKKLMKGNVKEISSQIDDEYADSLVAMATVVVKEKEGEIKEFQGVYNRAFLPSYVMKQFRLKGLDYNSSRTIDELSKKKNKDLRPHERFVLKIAGEYGCKDYYVFKELQDYDPEMNMVASDKTIADDDADY
jgi:hypothetical protein